MVHFIQDGCEAGLAALCCIAAWVGWGLIFLDTRLLGTQCRKLEHLAWSGDNFDFRTHFLSFRELLAPSIRLDWGASEPDFRFNLGVAQWVLGVIGLFGIFRANVNLLIPFLKSDGKKSGGKTVDSKIIFFLLSFILLIFLMHPIAELFWETVPLLPFFQFPWRFMGRRHSC